MDKKLHRLETFTVEDTQGARYKVHAYEHLARVDTLLDTRTEWEPTGVVEYKLETGEHLDFDEDGTMHVAGSGLPLHRVEPSPRAM